MAAVAMMTAMSAQAQKIEKLEEEHLDGDDGGIVRTVSKLSVWPVLNLRLAVRLF